MMKVLVTGASGNVGSYLVSKLLEMGEQVVAGGTDLRFYSPISTSPLSSVGIR